MSQPRFFRVPRKMNMEPAILLAASIAVGLLAGFSALALHKSIEWAFHLFFWPFGVAGGEREAAHLPWYGLLLLPAAGGLLLMPLLRWAAPEVRGSGIPEVLEALALRAGRIRKRVPFLKILATAISLGSGACAGREGPIVQIGGGLGSMVAFHARASVRQTRTLVACGAGAGIAAVFNMPFAGAIFALEVILGGFQAVKIAPIVASSVVATVVVRIFMGDHPTLMHVEFFMRHQWELALYALLGIFIGILSALLIHGIQGFHRLFSRLPVKWWWYPAIGGLAVGTLALFTPHRFGVGYYQINEIVSRKTHLVLASTLALTAVKLLSTSISVGSGTSGGIFAPSLVIGTFAGASFGLAAGRFLDVSHPSNYALIGMGAFLAGAMRAPISATLMLFELTWHPLVIVPLMLATASASIVSALLKHESIDHWSLVARGIHVEPENRVTDPLRAHAAGEIARRDAPEVLPDAPLGQVIARLLDAGADWGFVVDENGRYAGTIFGRDLSLALTQREHLDPLVVAADMAQAGPIARTSDDLALALRLMESGKLEVLAVVDEDGRFAGALTPADVFSLFHEEMSSQELQHTVVDAISLSERLGEIDLGDDHVLVEIEAPPHAYGKTLPELDIRRRFHIQVIMLRRRLSGGPEGKPQWKRWAPAPTDTLEPGDFLLVLGKRENIRNATKI